MVMFVLIFVIIFEEDVLLYGLKFLQKQHFLFPSKTSRRSNFLWFYCTVEYRCILGLDPDLVPFYGNYYNSPIDRYWTYFFRIICYIKIVTNQRNQTITISYIRTENSNVWLQKPPFLLTSDVTKRNNKGRIFVLSKVTSKSPKTFVSPTRGTLGVFPVDGSTSRIID